MRLKQRLQTTWLHDNTYVVQRRSESVLRQTGHSLSLSVSLLQPLMVLCTVVLLLVISFSVFFSS